MDDFLKRVAQFSPSALTALLGLYLVVSSIVGSLVLTSVPVTELWSRILLALVGLPVGLGGVIHARRTRQALSIGSDSDPAQQDGPAKGSEFLHRLDDGSAPADSFEAAFRDTRRIDLLLRTGANVLGGYQQALSAAAKGGAGVRILLLDPKSPQAFAAYGSNASAYLANARSIPQHLADLLKMSPKGSIRIRVTRLLPPFSMYIALKNDPSRSRARVQVKFALTKVARDRPTFGLGPESKWFADFQAEFDALWRSGKRMSIAQLQSRIDSLQVQAHNIEHASYDMNRQEDTLCPFDDHAGPSVYFEGAETVVLYDLAPVVEGHSLIVPKRHVERLEDLTDAERHDLIDVAHLVSTRLAKALGATGINWAIQDGVDAGQTVPHVHIHVIPRSRDDLGPNPGNWFGALPGGKPLASAIESGSRSRLAPADIRRRIIQYKRIMAGHGSE